MLSSGFRVEWFAGLLLIALFGLAFAAGGSEQEAAGPQPNWIRYPGRPLSITATEVTAEQFQGCVDAGSCEADHYGDCNLTKSGRDDHPMNCVSYFGAEQYCQFVAGRVCKEAEWLEACRGSEARNFPYGDTFEFDVCNYQSSNNRKPGQGLDTEPVSSNAQCQGGFDGLYDMAGNVAEWVDKCTGDYCKFRGGAYLTNDPVDHFTACGGVCAGNQKTFEVGTVGIRCCRDED